MNDSICVKKAMPLINKFGYTTINKNVLDEIIKRISKQILHGEYKNSHDAIKLIPTHANILIDFITIFNIYIDNCKNTQNYTHLKTIMCDNECNLCKIYHLLTSWGLMYIDCLKINAGGQSNRLLNMFMTEEGTIKNSVLYNKDTKLIFTDVKKCIQNTNESNINLKQTYYMISMALYLRKEFKYYCNKEIDKIHSDFINYLELLCNILRKKISNIKSKSK